MRFDPLRPHLRALSLLLLLSLLAVGVWLAVQSFRDDPVPSLVWAPEVSDEQILGMGPPVLDRLSGGWWWIETTLIERDKLRAMGARLAMAIPQPIARMAGCSGDLPVDPEQLRKPRQLP